MRKSRVNMVQTPAQYTFIHDAILEALIFKGTTVDAEQFSNYYKKLQQPGNDLPTIEQQYEWLKRMRMDTIPANVKSATEHRDKNRFPDIVPQDNQRPFLNRLYTSGHDYINAVYTKETRRDTTVLATQIPLPTTVADFWTLVVEHNVSQIVSMETAPPMDQTCAPYFPTEDIAVLTDGAFRIDYVKTTQLDVGTVTHLEVLNLKDNAMAPRSVRHLEFNAWSASNKTPDTPAAMLSLIKHVADWQHKTSDKKIVVACRDGASRSGLFAACWEILHRLETEQLVGVFSVCLYQRQFRPQFIPNLAQYEFCYMAIDRKLEDYEIYSNFR
ncbi:PREDICTED: receptor-type tyrosine-protein phosphatase U-like [Priapulus caudatus]|uniref:Receptor-type tyrosine-protein phosphatase U-like n=1 Tax=Priapulus caudatus TaxID=37621 RepID=A0ABM1EUS0_PRICU|nr:PREDICTED: receptor-type tyrosine-protein phosphatase U-like [Priapulus caudatus]